MKSIRHVAVSALLTLSAFGAITYTACTKDPCSNISCKNGGTCSGGTCTCPTGYEGTDCSTLSRDKFVGTYVGNENCTVGTDNYSITLSANSNALQLTLTNLYNESFTAVCTMTGASTFSFNGTSTTVSFNGTGTLAGANQLTVQYQISNSATSTSNACTFVGTK